MKTYREQIEVVQHYDNGGAMMVTELKSGIKMLAAGLVIFDWINYDYDIYEEVKPLFPTKKQGAKYIVDIDGRIRHVNDFFNCGDYSEYFAKQGRTFYTPEDAEAFVRREQAKTYCLEAINRVNEGDNGFKDDNDNYYIYFNINKGFGVAVQAVTKILELNEYIRTEDAVQELLSDAEFVENWKIWKGVE